MHGRVCSGVRPGSDQGVRPPSRPSHRVGTTQGLRVDQVVTEVGSPEAAADAGQSRHDDDHRGASTLARFSVDAIKAALDAQGDGSSWWITRTPRDDLARDMIHILTSFCARLYGRRGARSGAAAAVKAAKSVTI